MSSKSVEERFWEKVDVGERDECWLWQAAINSSGYGVFGLGGRGVLSHRVAYQIQIGAIPEGLELDHLCRVRHCVNPYHLEPVTHRENVRRSPIMCSPLGGHAGRAVAAERQRSKAHCPKGHFYDEGNTYIYGGRRYCRICRRDSDRSRESCARAGQGTGVHQRIKTHCPRGHAYDGDNTYVYRGMRQCRTCRRDRGRARYQAGKK